MTTKEIFKHWLEMVIENRERRLFDDVQKELESEILFAEMNDFDPLEYCPGCKLGICNTHFIPDPDFFIDCGSDSIEYWT